MNHLTSDITTHPGCKAFKQLLRAGFCLLVCMLLSSFGSASAQVPPFVLHHSMPAPADVQYGAHFGASSAIDGNLMVFGVPDDDTGAEDAGVVKIFDATTGALVHTLVNPGPAYGERFGAAVAILGNRVVVGTPGNSPTGSGTGCVYIYDLSSGTPTTAVLTINNPAPENYDNFGEALALSGNRLVVGARFDDAGAADAGSAYVFDLSSGTPTVPVATLNNPNPAASDQFGISVAIDGTLVAVGAWFDDAAASNAGTAYVYDLTSGTPTVPIQTLNHPGPTADAYFGVSVGVSGTQVAVGAHSSAMAAGKVGSVHVFDMQSLTPTDPVVAIENPSTGDDGFGRALALSGTRLIVGALVDSTGASAAGSVYVYALTGSKPAPTNTINNPTPAVQDRFGQSVALSGNRVLVGANFDDAAGKDSGTGYLYNVFSITPTLPVLSVSAPGAATDNRFGQSVAVSGSLVAVGADWDDLDASNSGSVTLYDTSSATPNVPVMIVPSPRPANSLSFGIAIALEGTRLVVGATNDTGITSGDGRVYVYDLAGATPTVPVLAINNPSPNTGDQFGRAVSVSGSRIVVGSPYDGTGGSYAGSAYVFDLNSATPTVPVLTLNNATAIDYFGWSVAISGTRIIVGAYLNDTGASDAGRAYVYDLTSATPAVPVVTLNNPTPQSNDFFGYAVAMDGARAVVGAYQDNTGANQTGSVYVYDLNGATPAAPVLTINNPSPAASDLFGRSVALSGARLVVGVYQDDTGASNAGNAYVYDLASATPAVPVATLINPSPGASDFFSSSVGISGTRIVIGVPYSDLSGRDQGAAYVFEPPSANSDLSALTLSTGTLSPVFATATTSYTTVLPLGTVSLTVTPTKAQSAASITVNGTPVTSGNASGSIALVTGANPISIVVTAEDGVTTKTYDVSVVVGSAGTLAFANTVFSVLSGTSATTATITVQRSGSLAGPVSCTLSSADGSATAPAQYTAQTSTAVALGNNIGTQTLTIPIAANATTTVAKIFTISLADASAGASLGSPDTATVVILPAASATDMVKPVVTITAPAKNAVIVDATPVTISGAVTDNIGVAKVQVSLNGGLTYADANLASIGGTSTTYSISLQPLAGVNSLKVRALDFKGNVSAFATQTFTHLRTLTVTVSGPVGSGGVDAGFVPTSARQQGKSYSITATPKAGFVFDGWTVNNMTGTGITTASAELPKLTFLMQSGLTLTAKFITNPFTPAVIGDFSGLIMASGAQPAGGSVASHATVGLCTAKLTGGGVLSGNVKIEGLTLPFTAQCDNTGTARFGPTRATTLMLVRPGKPSLTLALKADLTGVTKQLTGTLTDTFRGNKVAESNITANRHVSTAPSQYVKIYTARLKARASQGVGFTSHDYPQGDGYLTFQIKANGTVSMTGKLADDTPVTMSGNLSQTYHWPVFQQLYTNKGCIAADAVLDDTQTNTDATALNMLWFRPFQSVQWYPYGWDDGILIDMQASKYTPPPAAVFAGLAATNPTTGNTNLTFTEGLLAAPVTKFVNLTAANVLTTAPVGDTSFTFKPAFATGLISGTFNAGTSKLNWQGVLMQKGTNKGGHGYFMSAKPAVLNYLGEGGAMHWLAK